MRRADSPGMHDERSAVAPEARGEAPAEDGRAAPVKRRLSNRGLTLTYVSALSVIAILSLSSHFTLNRILREQHGSAAVVNVAGRQRMLSQRIAGLVAQVTLGDEGARSDLKRSIDEFERAHHSLLVGDRDLQLPAAVADPALRAMYLSGSHPVDAEVNRFVREARGFAAMPRGELARARTAPFYQLARHQLLDDLNEVVSVHARESEGQVQSLDRAQTVMLAIVLATLLLEAFVIFAPMIRRIMQYAEALTALATTDALTGALNRRSIFERGQTEIERARRYRRPFALMMIDADHFKAVNDRYGHDGGDAVLLALTTGIAAGLRTSDAVGRIGGEEFIVLLPETDARSAEMLADRLRATIAGLTIATKKGVAAVTISVGVACMEAEPADFKSLLARADEALYEAKEHGRNRVVLAHA